MSEEFGIFAKNILAKVTNQVSKFDKFYKIPVSIGFKGKDGQWVNEFFDIVVFGDLFSSAELIEKGDKIKVSGRVQLNKWTDKTGGERKSWQILASEIITDKPQGVPERSASIEDVPF